MICVVYVSYVFVCAYTLKYFILWSAYCLCDYGENVSSDYGEDVRGQRPFEIDVTCWL